MYNRSIVLKYNFERHLEYNYAIIDKQSSDIMVPCVDIIGLCHSVTIL